LVRVNFSIFLNLSFCKELYPNSGSSAIMMFEIILAKLFGLLPALFNSS
jgi:hypothetical protein